LLYFGEAQDDVTLYAELFGCGLGMFPLSMWVYQFLTEDSLMLNGSMLIKYSKTMKKMEQKLLSLGGTLVLITAVQYGTIYDFFLPTTQRSLAHIELFLSRFFWQGDSKKKKYRLAK
jgi:hypothetical protein